MRQLLLAALLLASCVPAADIAKHSLAAAAQAHRRTVKADCIAIEKKCPPAPAGCPEALACVARLAASLKCEMIFRRGITEAAK